MTKLGTKLIALLLTLSLCFAFASCMGTDNEGNKNGEEATASTTYVQIEINPSIELTVNNDGNVVSVYGTRLIFPASLTSLRSPLILASN